MENGIAVKRKSSEIESQPVKREKYNVDCRDDSDQVVIEHVMNNDNAHQHYNGQIKAYAVEFHELKFDAQLNISDNRSSDIVVNSANPDEKKIKMIKFTYTKYNTHNSINGKTQRIDCNIKCSHCGLPKHSEKADIIAEGNAYTEMGLSIALNNRFKSLNVYIEVDNFYINYGYCKHLFSFNKKCTISTGLYLSGVAKKCNSLTRKKGMSVLIRNIGPIKDILIQDENDDHQICIITEFGRYYLKHPHNIYYKHVDKLLERDCIQNILKNNLSTFKNVLPTYEQLVELMEQYTNHRGEKITDDMITDNILHVFDNIESFQILKGLYKIRELSKGALLKPKMRPNIAKRSKVTTTPLVESIFNNVFNNQIDKKLRKGKQIKKGKALNKKCSNESKESKNQNICSIKWIGLKLSDEDKDFYSNVKIGSLDVKIGDFVLIKPKNKKMHSILKIIYMWQNNKDFTNWFHGQFFLKSSETILQEIGNSNELFMQDKCSICTPLEYINDVLNVDLLKPEKDWYWQGGITEEKKSCKNNNLFYRKYYNKNKIRFENLPADPVCNSPTEKHKHCPSCTRRYLHLKNNIPKVSEIVHFNDQKYLNENRYEWSCVQWKGQAYRRGTSVFLKHHTFKLKYFASENIENCNNYKVNEKICTEYYRKLSKNNVKYSNESLPIPHCVGYINSIITKGCILINPQDIYLVVNIVLRPQNIKVNNSEEADLNMVHWTEEKVVVNFLNVVGPCNLTYIENIPRHKISLLNWSLQDDTRFYFKDAYNKSKECFHEVPASAKSVGNYLFNPIQFENNESQLSPLKCLDLFAGCGGLSEGLRESGVAKCHWAVEIDKSAAKAFQKNDEKCTVFTEDCNVLLRDIIVGNKFSHNLPLPKKGEVEMICTGPPCQGFSAMNRFNDREVAIFKNSLVVTSLSYCDYFRPKYVIFENVKNFTAYKNGMILKLTINCFLNIGYQCTFAIIQAGNFGIPQTRRRMILIAAAPGEFLPFYPKPTHSFNHKSTLSVLIGGQKFHSDRPVCSAPKRIITIRDAIGDLPPIEHDDNNLEMKYKCSPKSEYQKIARRNKTTIVNDHICRKLSALNYARISHVPNIPGADWRDLPNISVKLPDGTLTKVLKYFYTTGKFKRGVCKCVINGKCSNENQTKTLIPWFLPHTAHRNSDWVGVIGRTSWNGYFNTTLTNPHPLGKQGRVLHPEQNRIISVRECARSQGFPDSFLFDGNIEEKYKQIGNAVPPPLAKAIGREILSALKIARLSGK